MWTLCRKILRLTLSSAGALIWVCGASCGSLPRTSSPEDLQRLIDTLPEYAHFEYGGIGYYHDAVFAGSNLGVLEIRDGRLHRFYRWHSSHSVVSGPWRDWASDSLWFWDESGGSCIRRTSKGWDRITLPHLPRGYTRIDILSGFHGVSDKTGFWWIGANHAWKWNDSRSEWDPLLLPEIETGLETLAPADGRLYAFLKGEGGVLLLEGGAWRSISKAISKARVVQAIGIGKEAYARTAEGDVIHVTPTRISHLSCPGYCEALCRTSDGRLAAYFREKGIHVLEQEWRNATPTVCLPDEESHRSFLDHQGGEFVFARTLHQELVAHPHVEGGYTHRWSGINAIWRTTSGALVRMDSDRPPALRDPVVKLTTPEARQSYDLARRCMLIGGGRPERSAMLHRDGEYAIDIDGYQSPGVFLEFRRAVVDLEGSTETLEARWIAFKREIAKNILDSIGLSGQGTAVLIDAQGKAKYLGYRIGIAWHFFNLEEGSEFPRAETYRTGTLKLLP